MPSLSVVVLPDFFVQELQVNLVKKFLYSITRQF
jgi:hypothetical protein